MNKSIRSTWRSNRNEGESLRAFARRLAKSGNELAREWLRRKGAR